MAVDTFPPETETRPKPDPDDDSAPSADPVGATLTTLATTLEPPSPPATIPPPSPALEPVVPKPRVDEVVRVGFATVPKTSEERAWGLGFFGLVTLVFTLATVAALSWNWSYVVRLSGLLAAVQTWTWPPFPFPALPSAILATIQMIVLGAAAYWFLFPRHT